MRRAVKHSADTRQDLLKAGARVFALRGFQAATVREICRRAGSNLAAINYHFGGKAGLYAEVLAEGQRAMILHPPSASKLPPELRLRHFIRSFLGQILTESPDSSHAQLMFREMIEPTQALDRVVSEFIRPSAEELGRIVQAILGPGFSVRQRRHAGLSIVSQILNYKHCRPVILRLFPELPLDASQLEPLTEHITNFSLAALRGLRASQKSKPQLSPARS